ncbi:ankyrin [Sodiomyces alkalinus F11]|uniref:Ankyrin n=1 Tax=Sodiomyces alkalinus (strain CBS 110278 / VKM F-3762 / F11) TaxID=1314773 RepID=A0A3N2QAG1_SODAK|nr:ankyrin [Sodiomyces alkalinus F11]ROT43739.1 ankyrin [Sodiomyces alkalinus F11]
MDSTTSPQPDFYDLVMSFLRHGDREYLARILQLWNPAIDPYSHMISEALHRAIFLGDEAAVRMMLDAGVDPTVRQLCDPNFTPLLTASQYGRRATARLLWQGLGPDGRFYPSKSKRPQLTCLQVAARNGHADLVADFLDAWDGWPADEKDRALRDAAWAWRDDVVALLLRKVRYEADAIQCALEQGVGNKLILPENERERLPGPEDSLRQERLVRRLVDAGGNLDENDRSYHWPLIHKAAKVKRAAGALRALLEKNANPNVQDARGRTALHYVFEGGAHFSMDPPLRVLLEHGASPETADQAGETPLHVVANTGTLPQLLLCLAHSRDADVAIRLRNAHGESLLHYAAAGAREDIVEFLLRRGLHIDARSANGWTPLLCALAPTRMKADPARHRLASLLLRRGASARVVTEEGWTPLHALATAYPSVYAGQNPLPSPGARRLAGELISRGAPTDAESRVIRDASVTPRMLYDVWGYRMQRFAEDSTQAPAGSTAIDTTPYMWAMRSNAMDIFDVLMAHFDSAARDGAVGEVSRR